MLYWFPNNFKLLITYTYVDKIFAENLEKITLFSPPIYSAKSIQQILVVVEELEEQMELEQWMLMPVKQGKTDKIDKMETEEKVEEGAIEMEELILNKVETTLIFKTK